MTLTRFAKTFLFSFLLVPTLLLAAEAPPCEIIFDAGSSGTRLYIYELKNNQWIEHKGPQTSDALADPIRNNRGKTLADTTGMINDITTSLNNVPDFDWRKQCHVESVMVQATAGMRIAEKSHPQQSAAFYAQLKEKLQEALNLDYPVHVEARTIKGFEEGAYAWLCVRYKMFQDNRNDFGIAEMGGASTQIAYPCPNCKNSHVVLLNGQSIPLYSHSFLGLGAVEAFSHFKAPAQCAYDAGKNDSAWTEQTCKDQIKLTANDGSIINPDDNSREKITLTAAEKNMPWFLMGGFMYLNDKSIPSCCQSKSTCTDREKESSCFRAVYYKMLVDTYGVNYDAQRTSCPWVLGSAICQHQHCLRSTSF